MNMELKPAPAASSRTKTSIAIALRNAYKRYTSSHIVLNGLNITIMEGTVYGLLGASGCGKTTLLNCIAGRTNLDSGTIRLKINKRSELGFMPQTLSLHEQLSIFENFRFYGYLFGMSNPRIEDRARELISFLELPSADRTVRSLSGGQQRRASIAVTLMHDPTILILDEPTVGLDPIMSQTIWDHLLALAEKGKTIILTTNYIQEARRAHTIGLMRNGVLLAEETPRKLLQLSGTNNLEEAFLNLSQSQEMEHKKTSFPENAVPTKVVFEDDSNFSLVKLKGVMYKNVTLLKREYTFLIVQVILPLLTAVLFNVAIGTKPSNIKLGIVNNETDTANCSFSSYNGCFMNPKETVSLSCLHLEYLHNKSYQFIEYYDYKTALEDVRKNKIWGLLRFPANYTRSLADKIIDGRYVTPETLKNSFVDAYIDYSDQYIASFIKYDAIRSSKFCMDQALIRCGQSPLLGPQYISFEEPIFGSEDENFITYAASALLCTGCFFFPLLSTALLALVEKMEGIMERMMVAGASAIEMIISLVLIQIMVHMLQTGIVMSVLFWVYDNPLKGSILALVILMLLTGTNGMFHGFLLAAYCDTVFLTGYGAAGINFVICLTSGLLWPTEGGHYFIKILSWVLPIGRIVDATRGICLKNFRITHSTVVIGFASAAAWNILMFSIIWWFVRYRKGRLETETK